MSTDGEDDASAVEAGAENVRSVRLGHGANCSSLGSVVDILFGTAVVGAAVLAAVVAALRTEAVRVVDPQKSRDPEGGPSPTTALRAKSERRSHDEGEPPQ